MTGRRKGWHTCAKIEKWIQDDKEDWVVECYKPAHNLSERLIQKTLRESFRVIVLRV